MKLNLQTSVSKRRIFRYFIASYMVILIVPLILGAILYGITMEKYHNEAIFNNKTSINHSMNLIEQRLQETKDIVTRISLDETINDMLLFVNDLEDDNLYKIREALLSMNNVHVKNSFIKRIYFYFKKTDTIISHDLCGINTPIFYSVHLKYKDYDFSTFRNDYLRSIHNYHVIPSTTVYIKNTPCNVLTILKSLPLNTPYPGEGTAVVLIDTDTVKELLQDSKATKSDYSFILDSNNNVILQNSQVPSTVLSAVIEKVTNSTETNESYKHNIDKHNKIISFSKSYESGWTYVSIKSLESAVSSFRKKYLTVGLVWLIALIIGLVGSFYMAYRNYLPIRDIQMILSPDNIQYKDVTFTQLNNAIKRLINDKKALADTVQCQRPYLCTGFVERLLSGNFVNNIEINQAAKMASIDLKNKYVAPLLIYMPYYQNLVHIELINETLFMMSIVIEIVNKISKNYPFELNLDRQKPGQIAGIAIFDTNNPTIYKSSLTTFWNEVTKTISDEYNIIIKLNCGKLCSDMREVSRAFSVSKDMMIHGINVVNQDIICFDSKPAHNNFYYPLDIERKLINSVKNGDADTVSKMFSKLEMKNTECRALNYNMFRHLFYEISGTFSKIYLALDLDNPNLLFEIDKVFVQLEKSHNVEKFFLAMKNIFIELTGIITSKQHTYKEDLKKQIITFIDDSYQFYEFSLQTLADKFGFTFSYMSHYFKELMGQTFHEYLCNVRMSKAAQLLVNSNNTVLEIAMAVGYDNVYSFRRAFKRFYGVTPSSYKKMMQSAV